LAAETVDSMAFSMADKMADKSVCLRVASKVAKWAEKLDGGTVDEKEHQRADLKVCM
jgi:hypothetical protein